MTKIIRLQQGVTGKTLPGMTQPQKNEKPCKVEGCRSAHYGLGYCQKHWYRFKTYGDPVYEKPIAYCKVNGCFRKPYGHGYCQKHYQQLYHRGEITDLRIWGDLHSGSKCLAR